MDAALGPPEKMAEHDGELTPMMAQYFELCREYDDSLVLFQVGDFYEAFCEAAERVARLCEITLTEREDSTGTYPMAGVPIDNAESYIEDLLEAGYRVAVADQVEDPDETAGVVERAVTRVVTPGTLTEDELLERAENNYVACLTAETAGEEIRRYGLATLDVSTGEFYATATDRRETVADELGRFAPAEAIVGPDASADVFDADCMVSPYDHRAFDRDRAGDRVAAYFGPPERLLAGDAEIRACGALLAYAEYTRGGLPPDEQVWADGRDDDPETTTVAGAGGGTGDADAGGGTGDADAGTETGTGTETGADADPTADRADPPATLEYINHLTRYDPREYMVLDRVAIESLELFDRRSVRGHESRTLVETVDETASALGRRKLDDWLRRPLLDAERIAARHDAVSDLQGSPRLRERLAGSLAEVYDLERLISRVARGRATARDLRSLHDTLAVVPDVVDALADADSAALCELRDGLDPLEDVRGLIDRAIRENPAAELTEGGVLKPSYDDELADLRGTERDGKAWIDDLQARERERTGIDSLKVDHNAVHGYYIEVTDPNLDRVPDDYTRRQTLKNAERFVTPELKEREDEILRAERRGDDLEYELFCTVRREVAAESERVQALADRLARLDVFVSFASVAAAYDYTRPTVGADCIDIVDGRHPVVERTEERFVPNDASLDDDAFLAVITGPNMSGKSTYMRQVALIAVLAQAGSFVPAADAQLPVVDRVFTRVGASDDIAGGRSTFMVEMTELADILEHATEDSLVLLDEVGRGTSTADGLAIARAVTEYIHDEVGAATLFATHHHELTDTAEGLPGAFNLHFEVERAGGDVTFDHAVAPGAASASYGVEVASMADVPGAVVERARDLLDADRTAPRGDGNGDAPGGSDNPVVARGNNHDGVRGNGHDGGPTSRGITSGPVGEGAGGSTPEREADDPADRVTAELDAIDVATLTPLEALNALARLKDELDG